MELGFLKQTSPAHSKFCPFILTSGIFLAFAGRGHIIFLCALPLAAKAVLRSLILFQKPYARSSLTTTGSLTFSIFLTIFSSSLHHPHLLAMGSICSLTLSLNLASLFPRRKHQDLALPLSSLASPWTQFPSKHLCPWRKYSASLCFCQTTP